MTNSDCGGDRGAASNDVRPIRRLSRGRTSTSSGATPTTNVEPERVCIRRSSVASLFAEGAGYIQQVGRLGRRSGLQRAIVSNARSAIPVARALTRAALEGLSVFRRHARSSDKWDREEADAIPRTPA